MSFEFPGNFIHYIVQLDIRFEKNIWDFKMFTFTAKTVWTDRYTNQKGCEIIIIIKNLTIQ